jgi:peptidoglycan/xylan/chitin deacetylase (PgdA/CDA1 family)
MIRGSEAIKKVCGVTPRGFRAPAGELTLETLQMAKDLGFTYSSSLSDDDVPYEIELKNGGTILEIPMQWALYDLPYFVFYFDPPIPSGQSRISLSDDVLTNWKWEYDGAYRYGGCYVLQLDPQAIGSQGRVYMLEQILDYINEKGSAWIATGADIHHYYSDSSTMQGTT